MTKKITFFITAALMLLTMIVSPGRAVGQTRGEGLAYTLEPKSGSNNSYTGNCDITIDGITWNLAGNSQQIPWRIGGKNLSEVDRTLYSKTAIEDNISKIEVTHGSASNITVNSWTLIVASDSDFTDVISTLTPTFAANTKTTINRPTSADWTNCYYKFVYNVSVSGNSNRYLQFSQAKFYKEESGGGNTPSITAANVDITYDATGGAIAYTINNGVSGGTLTASTTSDWLTTGTASNTAVPFTCEENDGAERSATVTLTYTYGAKATVTKNVTVTQTGNPNAPGTQNNPYTVAEARAAIDAGTGVTSVYATGIVSAIPTAWSTQHNNITFNIVDESGDEDFLQAFRCVSTTSADASTVAVGDIVVVYGNMLLYQSTTYEFAQGCQLISLEHPSTPYFTANDVNITYDATGGNIEYTVENPVQGGQVNATTTSTWLTLSNNFASPIAFTCDANEAGERTATVTLTYTYGAKTTVNKEVTVTQAGNPEVYNNISDITAVGTTYSVKGTVVAINSRGFVMGDGTGYVYYYKGSAVTQTVNSKYTFEGKTGSYGNVIQFINSPEPTITASETSNYDGNPAATVITAVPDYSTGYHLSTYLEFEGALTKSNSNYFITLGESQIQISYPTTEQGNALTALNGKTVHVKGYFTGINSSSKFTVMLESAVEVAVPSITLNQYTYNLNADGGDAVLPVTYTNMPADPQAEVIFYEANGTTTATYDWITASINASYNIDGHIDTNTGEARTAYFKVKGIDANSNEVYSNLVTINQTAAGPHIEFNTTSYNLAVGGESKTISFDYSGLGSTPEFTVRFYDSTGETQTSYEWISGEITQGDKVTITVEANDGEARSAYFKVYGEGNNTNTESNLVTVTQDAYVVDYATLPFEYDGNGLGELPAGLTQNGLTGKYDNSPKMKFDSTDDWLLLKINETPGTLTFDIKGNSFSDGTFKVQTSENGETYTDLATYTELSSTQNESFNNLGENVRYIKWIYTEKVNGNVALGNIVLAKYAAPVPSITAEDVNIAYDATEGSITYTINNPVEGGTMGSMPISGGDWLTVGGPSNGSVALTCEQNTGAERTATVKLTYTYNNTKEAVTKDVTVTQAAAPATMYTVNFTLNGGTFVQNDDFTAEIVEIAAGTYTLPSATKAGYDFTGWNDGDQTYAAGDEYTVSADVDFTAQWTESTTGTIVFGTNNVKINATEVSGDDSMGNTWTITTEGTSSFTQNAAYSQVGSGSSPATSITFTMTLPQQKIISAFEAKFGGFNNTVGDINLYVGETNVGSGELDGTTDVIVEATTTTEVGTVLTVTVTNIAKGVKCYYISYTLSDAPVVPVIDATAGSALAYNATAGSIIYEIANYEAGTMTATTTADWINALVVTTPTAEDGEVTFNVTENTSNESRSATVTLTFTYGNPAATVTKDVTVTQNGQPSITVTPATANVAFAGSAPEFAVTYESLEIDDADDFDVEFYETSTSTTAGTQPTWITNVVITGNTTDGFTLTVTVAANDGAARDAYLKVYAAGSNDYIYSNLVTINQAAFVQLTTYSLVTSVDQIVSGKHYLFVGYKGEVAYAMGYDKGNNRNAVEVTVDNNTIPETVGAYEFVINNSGEDWTIYDNNVQELNTNDTYGFLYAAGGTSNNYLKTRTTNNDNKGIWTITIDDETHVASITAKSTGRNKMRFNDGNSPLFSCYSDGQKDIYLYVKDNDNNLEYYGTEITYSGNSIPDGGSITVGAGSVMTVPNNFENNDPNALVIEEGGQLIHESDVEATVQKGVSGYTNKSGNGWYLISSPVDNLPTSSVATGTYDLFAYDEATAYWWVDHEIQGQPSNHTFTTLSQSHGYLYANAADVNLNYAGTMKATDANIEVNLSYACDEYPDLKGFNLVGNPFTRNLTATDMVFGGTKVVSYYDFNADRTEFVTYQINERPIQPGQGFFIQATASEQKLVFNPTTPPTKDASDFKYISISAGDENFIDKAYIQFGYGNTLRKMTFGENTMVYVMNNDDDYAAARVEELAGTMPVHFVPIQDGFYTITVETKNIENLNYMHLIDNIKNTEIDLLAEPSYTFKASESDNADRFYLVFDFNNYTGVNENYTNGNFAYQIGDEIFVSGEGTLQVFDMLGRFVAGYNVNGDKRISTDAFNTGVYIFRMVGTDMKTQKIVVR